MRQLIEGHCIGNIACDTVLHPYRTQNNKTVFLVTNVYSFFNIPRGTRHDFLISGVDFISIKQPEATKLFGPKYNTSFSVTVFTLSGLIKIAAVYPANESAYKVLLDTWNDLVPYMNSLTETQLRLEAYINHAETTFKLLYERLKHMEQLPVPTDAVNNNAIPHWIDPEGWHHVDTNRRSVEGFHSPYNVAQELMLRTENRNMYSSLASRIMKTALNIKDSERQQSGRTWCTFIVAYACEESGSVQNAPQIRLTDEGLDIVKQWWYSKGSTFSFTERYRHGYAFDHKYYTYVNDPLVEPYKNVVNPTVGNVNSADIIDVTP